MSDIVTSGGRLPVSALVSDGFARVAPDASLHEVAEALVSGDVGALVVGDLDSVEGVLSERDLVRALATGRDPDATRAGEIATTTLVCADASATVGEVATQMMDEYVRHVLVEEEGHVVGIVSARDLLGAYAASEEDPTEL